MDLPCALRSRSEEDARRRRHPERCRVVLGDVVAVEARGIIVLEQLDASLEKAVDSGTPAFEMVEYAEFDLAHIDPQCVARIAGRRE